VLEQIFNPGDIILNGSLLAAIPMALLAGLVSFISPCVLPLLPGYLGFVSGFSSSRGRMIAGALLFVLGFSIVFVSFGALFGGIGAAIYSSSLAWVQRVLGIVVILLGFVLIGQFSFM
jgi:cytochrome c-type biogenesis protein